MLVVNVAGYNFSFTDRKTGNTILIPNDGKSHKIPDHSPLNFRELRYLNVAPMNRKEDTFNVEVDLSNNDHYNVDDIKKEYKSEIAMIEDEEEKPVKKRTVKKKPTKKKPLAGKRISVKKRKELLDKYSNNE